VRAWHAERPDEPAVALSVNLSARQLRHPALVADIAGALADTGLAPGLLTLELTERVPFEDGDVTRATLRGLKDLGVRFGTGFAGLGMHKQFRVDVLKIDRAFIAGLDQHTDDTAIVTALVAFAKGLGLDVTAQGIETEDQLSRLRAIGCHRGQGYHVARPLPAAEAGALLARQSPPLAFAAPETTPDRVRSGPLRVVPTSAAG